MTNLSLRLREPQTSLPHTNSGSTLLSFFSSSPASCASSLRGARLFQAGVLRFSKSASSGCAPSRRQRPLRSPLHCACSDQTPGRVARAWLFGFCPSAGSEQLQQIKSSPAKPRLAGRFPIRSGNIPLIPAATYRGAKAHAPPPYCRAYSSSVLPSGSRSAACSLPCSRRGAPSRWPPCLSASAMTAATAFSSGSVKPS